MAQRQKQAPAPRRGSTIVNDSTKSVYGPKTTLWTTEKDLFENRPNYRPLDTAVTGYDRWTYVQRFNNYYKDLGVMGTALNSIYPVAPSSIGAWAGFTAYDPYFATEEPRYYDTKSPFTRMRLVWGGNGRAMTHIEFARNINPRWNFGFNYRPILVDKQIQKSGKGDRQTVSQYYDFYTSYGSKNKRYFGLFTFRRMRHRVNENGGVSLQPGDPYAANFAADSKPYLTAAKTEEFRRNLHLFHQYQLAKPIQIYQILDFTKQTNSFSDNLTTDPKSYYDYNRTLGSDSTMSNDQYAFSTIQQEAGAKGNTSKLFYSAYYKFRTYSYSNPYADTVATAVQKSGIENYLGGRLSWKLDSVTQVSASAEYLFGGYYRIEGQIQSPWIEGYFKNSLSKPGMMQMLYLGSHNFWNKAFDYGVGVTQAQGFLKFNKGSFQLRAGGTFNLLQHYVYFKQATPTDPKDTQTVLPYQSSGTNSTLAPEVRMSIQVIPHVYFRPQVIYTAFLANDGDVLQIPQVFVNGQLAYENRLFTNHIQVQAGVDVHWHSSYQALAYELSIQQFYTQYSAVSQAFPLVDVFFTGKMGRSRFFFKYHNLVQAITGTGYLPTPNYPGTRNLIDFGFDFLLFD